MSSIPQKANERITKGIRRFTKIVANAKSKDVNESDTALIIADMLVEILGYDRYDEVTTEYLIRGTYCDLAVVEDDELLFLVEVKAIGKDLNDSHLRQAVNYAANEGIDWVVLTNGPVWRAYKMKFEKPISFDMVFEADLLEGKLKTSELVELFYLLSKEGAKKSAIEAFDHAQGIVNKYTIAAAILSEPVVKCIRRELRKLDKGVKIAEEAIEELLKHEVVKRDLVDGDKAKEASKMVKKAARKALKAKHENA